MRTQVEDLETRIQQERIEGRNIKKELDRVKATISTKARENCDVEDRIKTTEFDLQKSKLRENELHQVINTKTYEIGRRREEIGAGEGELANLRDGVSRA